ncbi:MAG: GNAT family N-acetyltransferase [Burkholderiales bacterium]
MKASRTVANDAPVALGLPDVQVAIVPWSRFVPADVDEWQALWEATGAAPDLSPSWARSLVEGHQLDVNRLQVLVARRAGELLMVWPFQHCSRRRLGLVGVDWVEPLQSTYCTRSGVLSRLDEAASAQLILATLRSHLRTWHWVHLHGLPASQALSPAWQQAAQRAGFPLQVKAVGQTPLLDLRQGWAAVVASRPKRVREKLRSMLRTLERAEAGDGPWRVEHFTEPAQMPRFMDLLLQIEQASWKHAAGSAISARPWEERTFRLLCERLAASGQVVGTVLFHEGRPAAHGLDLWHGQRVLGLKTSYDAAFARLRPGTLLTVAALSRYAAQGATEYDFLGDSGIDKREWTDQTYERVALRLYSPGWVGWVIHRALHLGRARGAGTRVPGRLWLPGTARLAALSMMVEGLGALHLF